MTTPAPSPACSLPEECPQAADPVVKRSRKVTVVLWACVAVIVLTGAMCYWIVAPFLGTRRVIDEYVRHEHIGPTAVDALGGAERAQERLRFYLSLPACMTRNRKKAVTILGWSGPGALPALVELTGDKDDQVRAEAVDMLCLIAPNPEDAVPVLEGLLDDPDADVRVRSALSIWRIKHSTTPRTIDVLIEALTCKSAATQARAVQALAEIGPPAKKATPALIVLLRTNREWKAIEAGITEHTAHALGKIRAKEAVPALIEVLEGPEYSAYEDAVNALGMIGPDAKAAVPALRRILNDTRESTPAAKAMRQAAAKALKKIRVAEQKDKQ